MILSKHSVFTRIAKRGAGHSRATFSPTYDDDGNQLTVKTATGLWNVTYNAENRPVTFTQGTTVIECKYDSQGRRFEKKVTANGTVTFWQRYAYRGYLQIAAFNVTLDETEAEVYTLATTTMWDPTEQTATRPLAFTDHTAATPATYFYTHDLTKNVCELLNTSGAIVTNYDYTPFGAVTASNSATPNTFMFSSEVYDPETALVYYNYRHYNPLDGRWINRDPIEEDGGWNLYTLTRNDTIIFVDILGSFLFSALALLGGVAVALALSGCGKKNPVRAGISVQNGSNAEQNLFDNEASRGNITPARVSTGEEMLTYLINMSKDANCICTLTIAGHGWSYPHDANHQPTASGNGLGMGIPGATAGSSGLYEHPVQNTQGTQGQRTLDDLKRLIRRVEIKFYKKCTIQIHSCRISASFTKQLSAITKCTVVTAASSCRPKPNNPSVWQSVPGIALENENFNKGKAGYSGFQKSVSGGKIERIGAEYDPQ